MNDPDTQWSAIAGGQKAMKSIAAIMLLFSILFGMPPNMRAAESGPSEYQVKAAFLYNFAKFVKWPDEAFAETNTPLVIGILGDNPFGSNLELAIKDKFINGHPLSLRAVVSLPEMKLCHVLFVCQKPKRNLAETLEVLKTCSVLTVSETEHFCEAGGMINFVMEGSRVSFEINDAAAKRAGLSISSKLLNLARKDDKGGVK
jgi:YfiR/HmsC-like